MHPKITNLPTDIAPTELVFFFAFGSIKIWLLRSPFLLKKREAIFLEPVCSLKKREAVFLGPVLAEPKTGSVGAKSL